jgi:hypothetical protein
MSKERAIELRNPALSVVKVRGVWQGTGSGPNLLMFHDGNLRIAYRSAISKAAATERGDDP